METEIDLKLKHNDRKSIRDFLIMEFLKEIPGTGNGENTSIYYYYVEKTKEEIDIYLKRPARLNKGMDFEVHAEGYIFENKSKNGRITRTSRPSHSTIIDDLQKKKQENPIEYNRVKELIEKIYKCEDILDEEINTINFKVGYPIELILKCLKWLFIEQDVTYWNWSGRAMFYTGIQQV